MEGQNQGRARKRERRVMRDMGRHEGNNQKKPKSCEEDDQENDERVEVGANRHQLYHGFDSP
jgi:hypothetical protein